MNGVNGINGARNRPKDLQFMTTILKDFGISEYEPGVENHMLDFAIRYITTILEDSQLYASHAKRKAIDIEDVKLAIELQQDKNFACPPSREITATLARHRNSVALPSIRSSAGLRLPPDRHSLTACNYQLKSASKKRQVHTIPRANVSNVASTNPAASRPSFNVQKPLQCPLIKFPDASNRVTPPTSTLSPMPVTTPVSSTNSSVPSQILMPTVGVVNSDVKLSNDVQAFKRPLDEDDDYDNN